MFWQHKATVLRSFFHLKCTRKDVHNLSSHFDIRKSEKIKKNYSKVTPHRDPTIHEKPTPGPPNTTSDPKRPRVVPKRGQGLQKDTKMVPTGAKMESKWRPGDPKIEVLDEKYNGQGASVLSFRIATKKRNDSTSTPKQREHRTTTTPPHHNTTAPLHHNTTTPLHQTPNTTNTQQQHTTHFPLLV